MTLTNLFAGLLLSLPIHFGGITATTTLYEQIANQPVALKAYIKSTAIADINIAGTYVFNGITVEIVGKTTAISPDGNNGIELFARAWKDGKQLGLGADGTTDLERFRIFNPPILVDDPTGDIITTSTLKGATITRILKENPAEAIKETLAHTISVASKTNTKIIAGSVGNTTDTFFPDTINTVDGETGRFTGAGESWALMRGGNGNEHSLYSGTTDNTPYMEASATKWVEMQRKTDAFDTSSIPDTDVISSATYSLFGAGSVSDFFSQTVVLVKAVMASDSTTADADFQTNAGAALQADAGIAVSAWSTSAYNDFTLNATGITNISVTGVSHFGTQFSGDQSNTEPTIAAHAVFVQAKNGNTAGTANDPKLVVVHAAAGGGATLVDTTSFEVID